MQSNKRICLFLNIKRRQAENSYYYFNGIKQSAVLIAAGSTNAKRYIWATNPKWGEGEGEGGERGVRQDIIESGEWKM